MRLIESRDAPKIGARTSGFEFRDEEITWSQPDLCSSENASNQSE